MTMEEIFRSLKGSYVTYEMELTTSTVNTIIKNIQQSYKHLEYCNAKHARGNCTPNTENTFVMFIYSFRSY
jgi:hypothetical protein